MADLAGLLNKTDEQHSFTVAALGIQQALNQHNFNETVNNT
jgi:hypothetical protein